MSASRQHQVAPTPVSYTHLDVYKRQGLWRINKESGKLEPFVAEVIKFGVRSLLTDAQETLYTVSYTHLDVYKRQGIALSTG